LKNFPAFSTIFSAYLFLLRYFSIIVFVIQALKGIPRQAYYIATKIGRYELDYVNMFDFTIEKTKKSIEKSLELLGVNYVDIIQVRYRTTSCDDDFMSRLTIYMNLIYSPNRMKIKLHVGS